MAKKIYILVIVILGFSLAPSVAYACSKSSSKTQNTCAKKENQHHKESENNCCKTDNTGDKTGNCCQNDCGNASCHCVTLHAVHLLTPHFINTDYTGFFSAKKQHFAHTEAHISAGFYSIWQPPKLG